MSVKRRIKANERLWGYVTVASEFRARIRFATGSHGSGNRLEIGGGATTKLRHVDVRGDDNVVTIGQGSWMRDVRIFIRGNANRIVVGERVEFGGPGNLWVEGDHGELRIGDGCTIEHSGTLAVLEGRNLSLGADCMIASEVEVRTGDSHEMFELADGGARMNQGSPVAIVDHVWMGKRAIVLKGVEIASGCVVGIGSVVTRSVMEPDSVLAGNPARVVRRDVRWQR